MAWSISGLAGLRHLCICDPVQITTSTYHREVASHSPCGPRGWILFATWIPSIVFLPSPLLSTGSIQAATPCSWRAVYKLRRLSAVRRFQRTDVTCIHAQTSLRTIMDTSVLSGPTLFRWLHTIVGSGGLLAIASSSLRSTSFWVLRFFASSRACAYRMRLRGKCDD